MLAWPNLACMFAESDMYWLSNLTNESIFHPFEVAAAFVLGQAYLGARHFVPCPLRNLPLRTRNLPARTYHFVPESYQFVPTYLLLRPRKNMYVCFLIVAY